MGYIIVDSNNGLVNYGRITRGIIEINPLEGLHCTTQLLKISHGRNVHYAIRS